MVGSIKIWRGLLLVTGVLGGALVLAFLVQNGWALWSREPVPQFPMEIPGTTLVIRNILTYEGEYLEDESMTFADDIAAIHLVNTGSAGIDCARVVLQWEQGTYVFDVDMLPAGGSVIVLEKYQQSYDTDRFTSCAGVQKTATGDWMSAPVTVTPRGDTKLEICNPTDRTLTDVRICFKNYLPEEDLFVGGIVYAYRIGLVAPGERFIVEPYRYLRGQSRIVGIETGNPY